MAGEIERLSEGCLSHVLSLTSPGDTCRASAASAVFRSAAASDLVWRRFLPHDYHSLLARADAPLHCPSLRDLFFRLCDAPILIDRGSMSFGLDKLSGAKCFMLSARALTIVWGENSNYWRWFQEPDSRFSEVAELLHVCWLEIRGEIESKLLSPRTTYVAYLVFRLRERRTFGLYHPLQKTSVKVGDQLFQLKVRMQPNVPPRKRLTGGILRLRTISIENEEAKFQPGTRLPQARDDGWMEVELGEFYNSDGEDGEVKISLMEIEGGRWKSGLIVQGIEIRPKRQCK